MLQSDQQRITAALALVSQCERDVTRILAVELTEHSADVWGVGIDVWQHDNDVARAQRRIGAEAGEELVMQDLDFALGAVGDMETHRAVLGGIDFGPHIPRLGKRAQLQDIVLQLVEQISWLPIAEQIDAPFAEYTSIACGIIIAVEQVDIVASLLAPRSQQRMGMLMQGFIVELQRHALLALLAFVLVPQQVFVSDDIGPVMAAGIVYAKQYLAETGKAGQRFEGLARQRRDAEHDDSRWQPRRRLLDGGNALDETVVNTRPALCHPLLAHVQEQSPPQLGLPAVTGRQRLALAAGGIEHMLAFGPVLEPVSAVDLILVEEVGKTLRELIALAQIVVIGEESAQGLEMWTLDQLGQQAHETPGKGRLVEQRHLGDFLAAQHPPI
ncbi:hypothetical protein PS627_04559 [Pseudomonas fluorescens]|nr:hypothetical protein PS627_04559 [Pseudomonas fluorescens]